MAGVTTRKLEGHKKTNSVKDFFKKNLKSVSKEYATVLKAVVALLSQYEQDSTKEEVERNRNLVRLIVEQHTGMLVELTKDNATWKKVRQYIHKKISSAVKDYFQNDTTFKNIESEINSVITKSLVEYRKKVVSKVSVVEEEQEGLTDKVIRKSVDNAFKTKEFKDFQKQLGTKIDEKVKEKVEDKDGLIEQYKKKAVKYFDSLKEKKTSNAPSLSKRTGTVGKTVKNIIEKTVIKEVVQKGSVGSSRRKSLIPSDMLTKVQNSNRMRTRKRNMVLQQISREFPVVKSQRKNPLVTKMLTKKRVGTTRKTVGTKRNLIGSSLKSVRKTVRTASGKTGKNSKKKSKRKKVGLAGQIIQKGKTGNTSVSRKLTPSVLKLSRKSKRNAILRTRAKSVKGGNFLMSFLRKSKTGFKSFRIGFVKFYNGKFMKKVRTTITKFVKIGVARFLGGLTSMLFLPILGLFKLGLGILKFAGKILMGVGKAIVSGVRFLWKGVVGIFHTSMNLVKGMFSSVYKFMTRNTVGKIITLFFTSTGGFLLGYAVGWLWSKVIKPAWGKITGLLFEIFPTEQGMDFLNVSVDNIKNCIEHLKTGFGWVIDLANSVINWGVKFIKELPNNPIYQFVSWILGLSSLNTIIEVIKGINTIGGGVGGQIAKRLPGWWRLVGYLVNGAFRGFGKLFDGREKNKLVLNERYDEIFGQNVKNADFSSVKDKGKLKSLQDKQMTISHEYDQVKNLKYAWDNDISKLLSPEGTDESRLGDPSYRRQQKIKYTLGDFPKFIENVLTSQIFGKNIDWGNKESRRLLYSSNNFPKQRELINNILDRRLSVLQDFGNLLSSGDRATLEKLADTSMEDNYNYLSDKIHNKSFDPSSVPQVKISKTDDNATRNLVEKNTARIKIGGETREYKVGDRIRPRNIGSDTKNEELGDGWFSKAWNATGRFFNTNTAELERLEEMGGKRDGDFIIVTPQLAEKFKHAGQTADPKDLESVQKLSEAIGKARTNEEIEWKKKVQEHDRKVVQDMVKQIDLIDFGTNNIMGVFDRGNTTATEMSYAR